MKFFRFTLFLLIFLSYLLLPTLLFSQQKDNLPWNAGIFLAPNINFFSTEVNFIQNNVTEYSAKDIYPTFGFGAGLLFNYPITKDIFISGSLGYHYFNPKADAIYYDLATRIVTRTAEAEDFKFSYFEFYPSIKVYNILPSSKDFYLTGGVEISSFLTKELNGFEIPDVQTRVALGLGAGYTFRLSPQVFLTPELSFRLPLTKIADNTFDFPSFPNVYSINKIYSFPQLRFSVALTFGPSTEKKPREVEVPADKFLRFKEVTTYDEKNQRIPVTKIKVEDTYYKELFPLVPYVFFEENLTRPTAGTLETISGAESGEFSTERLELNAFEVNKRILDIVGFRLKNNPRADLTLVGTLDGSKKESQNKTLNQERANYVRDYLVQTWGINPQRINLRTVNFPSKPSTTRDPEGVAENRRVELSSSNPEILAPIELKGENVRIAQPEIIEFVPETNLDEVESWEFTAYQGERPVKSYSSFAGEPLSPIIWNIKPNTLANSSVPVDYKLTVRAKDGFTLSARGTIPVEYFSSSRKKIENQPDKTIARFSLILFDFDKADVSQPDQEILKKYVIPEIQYNSTVKIYGFTDRIGDEGYNKNLALRRAEAVKSIILKQKRDVKIETYAVGESDLFDNNYPTGRHLCRTVQIIVETPK